MKVLILEHMSDICATDIDHAEPFIFSRTLCTTFRQSFFEAYKGTGHALCSALELEHRRCTHNDFLVSTMHLMFGWQAYSFDVHRVSRYFPVY